MKEFFNVETIEGVLAHVPSFVPVGTETVPLAECLGRVLAEDVYSDVDIPDFNRSTMDGFAVKAASTFGASEANPAYLNVKGKIRMGVRPEFSIGPGEAARIATGGMLPDGADSVIMVEHTDALDDTTIEANRSVAPGQHVIEKGEDIRHTQAALVKGTRIRPQEDGLLAACGRTEIAVFRRPRVGIISSGDEVVPVDQVPGEGQIRDINTHTLSGQVKEAGGMPGGFGIVRDSRDDLMQKCRQALVTTDMVMISGGSSVGARDFTVEVLDALPDTEILVHGISISPWQAHDPGPFRGQSLLGIARPRRLRHGGLCRGGASLSGPALRTVADRSAISGPGRAKPQPGLGPGTYGLCACASFRGRWGYHGRTHFRQIRIDQHHGQGRRPDRHRHEYGRAGKGNNGCGDGVIKDSFKLMNAIVFGKTATLSIPILRLTLKT